MREIKYRAWDKHNTKWVMLHGRESLSCYEVFNGRFQLLHGNDWEWQQYTGLKDKNGVEIYEGDIVRYPKLADTDSDYSSSAGVSEVTYEDGRYWAGRMFGGYVWHIEEPDFAKRSKQLHEVCEVIGNIYENPELLSTQTVE